MLFNPFGFKYQGSITGQVASPPVVSIQAVGSVDLFAGDIGTMTISPYATAPTNVGMSGYVMPQIAIGGGVNNVPISTLGVFQSFTYVDNQTNQLIKGAKAYPKNAAANNTLFADMIIDPGAIYSVQLDTTDAAPARPLIGEYCDNSTRTTLELITVANYTGAGTVQYNRIPGTFTDTPPSNQGLGILTLGGGTVSYFENLWNAQAYIIGLTAGIAGNTWATPNPIVDVILCNYAYQSLSQFPQPAP